MSNFDVHRQMANGTDESEAKKVATLVEWLHNILPNLSLPIKASSEELRACLVDGTVLCRILSNLKSGSFNEGSNSNFSTASRTDNIKRFLATMDELGLPKFEVSELEKGSMKAVIECLLKLRAQLAHTGDNYSASSPNGYASRGILSPICGEERQKAMSETKAQRSLRSPMVSEPLASSPHKVGHKFHEVFQMKQGSYVDLPPAKITEMMKSNSLDNAPTQSLLSVVNGILDESVERTNGEIPHVCTLGHKGGEILAKKYRVACLLRKVVQEIERRISTQAEHLRTQNNLFKAREGKYQSKIKVLEALASGTGEETAKDNYQVQQTKIEKAKMEENEKLKEEYEVKLTKERDKSNLIISTLRQEIETTKMKLREKLEEEYIVKLTKEKDKSDLIISVLRQEVEKTKIEQREKLEEEYLVKLTEEKGKSDIMISALRQEVEQNKFQQREKLEEEYKLKLTKEKDESNLMISTLRQDLESAKKTNELICLQLETESSSVKSNQDNRIKELEQNLVESSNQIKKLEQNLVESSNQIKELEHHLADSKNKVKTLEVYSDSSYQSWNKKEQSYKSFMNFQLGSLRELGLASMLIKQEVLKTQGSYSREFNLLGEKLKALSDAAANYHEVLAENRKFFNEIQDLKGNIRVCCRIRPFLSDQQTKRSTVEYIGENGELVVANPSKSGKDGNRLFKFNKVFGPDTTQGEVFSDIQPLIRSVIDGYNVCIFAYGQTGSGKTYTMSGPNGASEENMGVNYRALNDLFHISRQRKNSVNYEVGVQMVEIYNEQVRDLLSSGSQKKLGIVSTAQATNGLAVPDASMHPVNSTSDVIELMDVGLKNRASGATALNERSSRSHSVLTIHVRGKDLKTGVPLHGNLHLVDLAGSERVDRSEVTGDRLKEAQHINKSLSALGDVIFALAQKSPHVPYRNSKLTQVLQSSLGGQAKTLMLVQLNPDANSYSESVSTLKFAERVSGVELGAARSSKEGRDVRELMEQVAALKNTIAKKDDEIERLQLLKDLKNVYSGINGEKNELSSSTRYEYSSPSRDSVGESPKYPEADSLRLTTDSKHENKSKVAEVDEERLSDVSDSCLSMGTDLDGSIDDTRSNDSRDPPKSRSVAAKVHKYLQRTETNVSPSSSASKTSAAGIRRSVSNSTLPKQSSKRWS